MKKARLAVPILLSLILMFTAACGSSNFMSTVISDKMKTYGEDTVRIVDEYLGHKTDYKTAEQELAAITGEVQEYVKTEESKRFREDRIVASRICTMISTVGLVEKGAQQQEELIFLRDNLADKINIKEEE